MNQHRKRDKNLGTLELIAIALGGMVGGGIFTVLGVSVSLVGAFTPLAIFIGGMLALLAAYAYIKLAVYYQDEGATYAFFKRTFSAFPTAISLIGWYVVFGYISTMALYAYTFASYALSGFSVADSEVARIIVAGAVILFFALVNIWSVKGMGKLEDVMVYTKLLILVVISFVLINNGEAHLPQLMMSQKEFDVVTLLMVASITFVAYEGFQLVINAVEEIENPKKKIPNAIYAAIGLAVLIYMVISWGAIVAIPFEEIIQNKEYALAAGVDKSLGHFGTELIIVGALLATSSAISGTMFGASRLMAVVSNDGYLPGFLSHRKEHIPVSAIGAMSLLAFILILSHNLELILEFGSITFLFVSMLMAYANYKIRHLTNSSWLFSLLALFGLVMGILLILIYEFMNQPKQIAVILVLYLLLAIGATFYARKNRASEGR